MNIFIFFFIFNIYLVLSARGKGFGHSAELPLHFDDIEQSDSVLQTSNSYDGTKRQVSLLQHGPWLGLHSVSNRLWQPKIFPSLKLELHNSFYSQFLFMY